MIQKSKKVLTSRIIYGIISLVADKRLHIKVPLIMQNTERYRSGHNEAVLKTVWVQAHKGSNPFLSAIRKQR